MLSNESIAVVNTLTHYTIKKSFSKDFRLFDMSVIGKNMSSFEIAFNKNRNLEYFLFKNLTHTVYREENLYELSWEPTSKVSPIGTFLLEFLNTDLKKDVMFKKFILKYLFQSLYYEKYPYLKEEHLVKDEVPALDDGELDDALNKICEEDKYDFSDIQKDLFKQLGLPDNNGVTEMLHEAIRRAGQEPTIPKDDFDYRDYLTEDTYIKEISISFDKAHYFEADISYDETVSCEDIPYSFYSDKISDILFITVKEFKTRKNATIRQCQNCNKYFIPENLNNTKYCSNIYKNKKTCMELGKEIAYKKSLKNDTLLQKYRKRYMSLASNVSHYGTDTSIAKFEDYKETGSIMKEKYINKKISPKEFEKWIDGTKSR